MAWLCDRIKGHGKSRKQSVPEKESVWNGPVSERMPAFVYPGKERTMARKKKLSKFLPRLLAAAVAAATLIGSGSIGGMAVYAAEMGTEGTEDIPAADAVENEETETEPEVWDEIGRAHV